MRMAERLGDDAVDKKEPGGEVKPAKSGQGQQLVARAQEAQERTNMCTRSLSPSPTMRQKGESRSHGRPVSRPKTRMRALDVAKRAT